MRYGTFWNHVKKLWVPLLMVYIFCCCIIVKILDLNAPLRLIQKTWLFSEQIGMSLANALKSVRYTDTVLFLTIVKLDIYQHKSFDKSAADFIRVTNKYWNWLPTYLNLSVIDIPLTNIQQHNIFDLTNRWKIYCIRISYRF
jgi:hypothetical protein